MSRNWPNGLGESTGDPLVVNAPFYMVGTGAASVGDVWYVNAATGNNAYDGRAREKPLATIATAIAKSSQYDVIVCLDGHAETINTTLDAGLTGLTIVGAGKSGSKPTVTLTAGAGLGNNPLIQIGQILVSIRNIYFAGGAAVNTGAKIYLHANEGNPEGSLIKDCYFECGPNDHGYAVRISSAVKYLRIQGSTFVSTATTTAAQPLTAVAVTDNAVVQGMTMEDCVFDGGVAGFSRFYAFDSATAGLGISGVKFERITLLNGADMFMSDANDVGFLNVNATGRGSRVNFA